MRDEHHTLGLACLILAVVLLVMYYIATPSHAQEEACMPRDALEKKIFKDFGESPIGAGLTRGGIFYITENPKTGSFTVLVRRPDGTACVLMGGTGWASTDALIPGVGL